MVFVLLTVWFAFNIVLGEYQSPYCTTPRANSGPKFRFRLVENQPYYCRTHACTAFKERIIPSTGDIRFRTLAYEAYLSSLEIDKNFPLMQENLKQMTAILDINNQTGPKIIRKRLFYQGTVEVLVYYPYNHRISNEGALVINCWLPQYVFVWSYKTRETDPDSYDIQSGIQQFYRKLKQRSLHFTNGSYLLAFYEDYPFKRNERYVEIWVPLKKMFNNY